MYASIPCADAQVTALQALLPPLADLPSGFPVGATSVSVAAFAGWCRYLHPRWSYRRCAFADGTTFRLRAVASFPHDTGISR
ncbi:MAG: hypothetical protein K2L90_06090, partial [Muribaculaceae bacterium]|nr:hypothetical protein [Muribaculaceae bacterium]